MTELFIGLLCFILGMFFMYIFNQIEYRKLSELSEKSFHSTFNVILEIFKIVRSCEEKEWYLTWKCEACRKERPDDKISVYLHPWNLGGHDGYQNLKYCNDNPNCLDMVKTHDLFELRRMAKENEDDC